MGVVGQASTRTHPLPVHACWSSSCQHKCRNRCYTNDNSHMLCCVLVCGEEAALSYSSEQQQVWDTQLIHRCLFELSS